MAAQGGSSGVEFLESLQESGNHERAVTEARRILSQDPEDFYAHYCHVISLSTLDRHREAKASLDFLLSSHADSVEAQHAATFYYTSSGKFSRARPHVLSGLRIDPDDASFLFSAALIEVNAMKVNLARQYIDRARQLQPEDPEIVNLHIRIHAATENSSDAAFRRLNEYQRALKLDPENASLHDSIGDVYLDELGDAKAAEKHYRIALLAEPRNVEYQRSLFQAVAKRNLIYHLFSLPSRTFAWLRLLLHACMQQPWRILLFLIGGKFVLGFLVWLVCVTSVFWPGGKVYEWLLVSEMKAPTKASLRSMQWWHRLRSIPTWVRFGIFLVVNCALWAWMFSLLGVPLSTASAVMGWFVGGHFLVVSLLWLLRKARARSSRLRQERRQPPPMPSDVG